MYNNNMKRKINTLLCVMGLLAAIIFSNCAATPRYDFSLKNTLKNTLSIFMLNNGNDHYFCIPVQYVGDYQIDSFEFNDGNILIGDYDILLKRDEINIHVYLNEDTDEFGNSDGEFKLIRSDEKFNHYNIFIEKYLTDNEMKKIADEYKRGSVYSRLSVWYDIAIDNEEQNGSGMLDDFELYDGPAIDPAWFLPNLDFFRTRYLQI